MAPVQAEYCCIFPGEFEAYEYALGASVSEFKDSALLMISTRLIDRLLVCQASPNSSICEQIVCQLCLDEQLLLTDQGKDKLPSVPKVGIDLTKYK